MPDHQNPFSSAKYYESYSFGTKPSASSSGYSYASSSSSGTPGGRGIDSWMDNFKGSAMPSWSTVATSSFSTSFTSTANPWATPSSSKKP
ncbi:hypothetical protein SCUCBS95973_009821 [Sporothrix curviconia]|uniref:Uncharacterized protein n=1 Tax=Sporothrix curviconia TaxID=1260050 RepID=A0ABP0D1S3_9PEZI